MKKRMLLPKVLAKTLPPLGATRNKADKDVVVPVKFFSEFGGTRWYCVEYDPDTKEFFGLVVGCETELGYFTLDALEAATMFNGLVPAVERAITWDPSTTLAQVRVMEAE